jgi:D-glucosaminate-6-phosphate ammonia-lyase
MVDGDPTENSKHGSSQTLAEPADPARWSRAHAVPIYERLGVRQIINAGGALTRLGGTLMLPAAVEAMVEASRGFVRMDELQARAGAVIAEITGAESGYVVSGAAAGVQISIAAAIAGTDPARIAKLPDTSGMANEVIMQKGHRVDYDHAARAAGASIVEIGLPGETLEWELEAAISEKTAAVLHVANRPLGPLELPVVSKIAHVHGVPVVVDAAAALPPVENLRRFLQEGADVVVFSGGKSLRGPQASGIVAGRAALIHSIALQHEDLDIREEIWRSSPFASGSGRPYQGLGRSLKVGKEEVVGVLVALQAYVAADHAAEERHLRDISGDLVRSFDGIPGISAAIQEGFGGRTQPVVRVAVDEVILGIDAATLVLRLEAGEPPVCVNDKPLREGAFIINPATLADDEVPIVIDRLRAASGR